MNQYKHLDKNVLNIANSFAVGESNLNNLDDAIGNASKATAKFGATLKTVAANVGIMLAITASVKIATWAWDKFNTTVGEAQSDLEETQCTIKSLKEQIKELEGLDANSLTQGQKDKLENLKEQLKVQEQLEAIEKRRLAREVIGNGNWADRFDKDSFANASAKITENIDIYKTGMNGRDVLYQNRKANILDLNDKIENAKTYGYTEKQVEQFKNQLEQHQKIQDETTSTIIGLQEGLISNKSDILAWINTIEGYIADGSLVGDDLTKANENLEKLYSDLEYTNEQISYTNTLLYGGDDSWENVLAEKTQYSLKNLRDQGFKDDELQLLSTLTFDKNATLEELRTILEEAQKKANENPVEPEVKFSKSQMIDTINSMSDGFDVLDEIYADVFDKGSFDFTKLDSKKFSEAFKGLESEYSDFIETVSSSPTDINACQDAFNNLATAFIKNKGVLENLTEENAKVTAAMLENMGIENAAEIVTAQLAYQTEALALEKQFAAKYSHELADATYDEINAFLDESTASNEAKFALVQFAIAKINCNDVTIDTANDITNLLGIAKAASFSSEQLLKLEGVKRSWEHNIAIGNEAGAKLLENQYKRVLAEVKNDIANFNPVVDVTTKITPKYTGAKETADAIKDAADKATDALEKEKEALEDLKNEYDELYDAIQWFYDKQIDKIDKKIDALNDENEALEKQQENMDKILAAIESNYDAEIKLIQDKIDALKDENDEEERALALEEAKRKLQEAKSRKTLMVYQKGVGFTYQVDTKSIKEAEDELEELQENEVVAELEKQIEKLEEAKEKWSEIPEAYEKAMQEIAAMNYFGKNWKEITLNPSDELLNNFEGKYTGIQSSIAKNEDRIESYEKEKEKIEELKQAWEDAKNEYQYSQYEAKLNSFFGSDYEYQLLHNSSSWRRKFADEYSSICAEIEALEERIKASNESTASSTEKIGDAVANAKQKASEGGTISTYLWGEKDDAALAIAQERLNSLNGLIQDGNIYFEDSKNKVESWISAYSGVKENGIVTQELINLTKELEQQYGNTGTEFSNMLSDVSAMLADDERYSKQTVANLDTVKTALDSIATSETAVEEKVDSELSSVDKTILDIQQHISDLKTSLTELEGYKSQVETLATTATGELQTKVSEIQDAIKILNDSISLLNGELGNFIDAVNKLDSTNIILLTTAFGGSGGEGASTGLLGAVHSVVKAIDGGEESDGLVQKLAFINKQENIQTLIDAFGIVENGTNLLSAVQTVANKIYTDGDNTCLYSIINKLTETISNINLVKDAFNEIGTTVDNCITLVNDLKTAIEELPTEHTIKIKIEQEGSIPRGIGTAHTFGTGTAFSGTAYASGTGKWGLPSDKPGSLVAEQGSEIVVRDGKYRLISSPTLMDLKKGDIVFNHKQTEAILKNGKRSVIDNLANKSEKIVNNLNGFAYSAGTVTCNAFDAILNGLQLMLQPKNVLPEFAQKFKKLPNNPNEQKVEIHIGDIHVHGVQDVNGLSDAIIKEMPNMVIQKINKRR